MTILKCHKYQCRDGAGQIPLSDGAQADLFQIAKDGAAAAKAERIAKQHPHGRRQAHNKERRHHRIQYIFPPDQSSIEKRQPWRHEKYKCCA